MQLVYQVLVSWMHLLGSLRMNAGRLGCTFNRSSESRQLEPMSNEYTWQFTEKHEHHLFGYANHLLWKIAGSQQF